MKLRAFTFAALAAFAPMVAHADTKPAAPAPKADKAAPPAKDPAPAKVMSDADAKRFLTFFNSLIDTVVQNQENCPKMASSLTTLFTKNSKLLEDAKKMTAAGVDLPKEAKDKIDARSKNELVPALQKKCMNDKDVQAALMKAM
ncbi:MAG TPA: hypothetical protein VGM39_13865 [Kofleriaceae bacterium]|jgi:hypothetical protein